MAILHPLYSVLYPEISITIEKGALPPEGGKMSDNIPDPIEALSRFLKRFAGGGGEGREAGGRGGKSWPKFALIALIVLYVALKFFFTYVGPDEFGIKRVKIGPSAGIEESRYETGLYFVVPGITEVFRFPKKLQGFEMTNQRKGRLPDFHYDKAAHIQTSDGFYVDVDVTILYRIADPYLIATKLGTGHQYRYAGIEPKAEPILKEALGTLTTEEFYNSPLRFEKTLMARELLNKDLAEKGLTVDHVLIRYFKYSKEIQKNIEEKKLKDQLVFKNQAEARAAQELAKLKKVTQEGIAEVNVKLEEGKAYVMKKNAERDLYSRKRHADADLQIKLAEAEKTRLINQANRMAGSDRRVAIEMAEVLTGLDLIVLPSDGRSGVNPLDLTEMLKLFGVSRSQ